MAQAFRQCGASSSRKTYELQTNGAKTMRMRETGQFRTIPPAFGVLVKVARVLTEITGRCLHRLRLPRKTRLSSVLYQSGGPSGGGAVNSAESTVAEKMTTTSRESQRERGLAETTRSVVSLGNNPGFVPALYGRGGELPLWLVVGGVSHMKLQH